MCQVRQVSSESARSSRRSARRRSSPSAPPEAWTRAYPQPARERWRPRCRCRAAADCRPGCCTRRRKAGRPEDGSTPELDTDAHSRTGKSAATIFALFRWVPTRDRLRPAALSKQFSASSWTSAELLMQSDRSSPPPSLVADRASGFTRMSTIAREPWPAPSSMRQLPPRQPSLQPPLLRDGLPPNQTAQGPALIMDRPRGEL